MIIFHYCFMTADNLLFLDVSVKFFAIGVVALPGGQRSSRAFGTGACGYKSLSNDGLAGYIRQLHKVTLPLPRGKCGLHT